MLSVVSSTKGAVFQPVNEVQHVSLAAIVFNETAHNTQATDHVPQRSCSGRLVIAVFNIGSQVGRSCNDLTVDVSVIWLNCALDIRRLGEANWTALSILGMQGLIASTRVFLSSSN